MEALMLVATLGGPTMFARIGIMRAVNRRVEPAIEARILELRASGDGILKIGRKLGIGTSVVQRVFKQAASEPANLR
jgi:hypothetical protein